MKVIITENQLKTLLNEQQNSDLMKVNNAKQKVKKIAEKIDSFDLGSPISDFLLRVAAVESCYGLNPRAGNNIWQVDPIAFEDTQAVDAHPNLKTKYEKLSKVGIDWKSKKYSDIIKNPILNCIAARLYLSNKPGAIGDDISSQANYWKRYYNTGAGAGSEKDFINKNSGKGLHNCVGYV
jgi:hypothetical protein